MAAVRFVPQRSRFAACRVQPAHGQAHYQPELESVWVLIEWPAGMENQSNIGSPTYLKTFRYALWCAWPS